MTGKDFTNKQSLDLLRDAFQDGKVHCSSLDTIDKQYVRGDATASIAVKNLENEW